ncbi:unnamed protein product [Rhizoctonia solani]|uniref:Uncharacterized protein n=1 Tax=Rhizoctonia solani TaxID=456999 RepID=A0A8H3CX85_9AGAM|nr:unnamed protein product [Rhizoctonia solani]
MRGRTLPKNMILSILLMPLRPTCQRKNTWVKLILGQLPKLSKK